MSQSERDQRFHGPLEWEDAEPAHVYPSGTVLRPFNDGLNLRKGLLRMSVARIEPGQDVDHHDHFTMSEVYYLLQGKGQFRVGDQLIDAEQNTAMYFEPGVMRSVVNNSDEVAWWLFVGSPPDVNPNNS